MAVSGCRRHRSFKSTIERMSVMYHLHHSFVFISECTQRNVWKFTSPDFLALGLSGLLADGSFLGTQNVKDISLMSMNCLESYTVTQRTSCYDKSQGLNIKNILEPFRKLCVQRMESSNCPPAQRWSWVCQGLPSTAALKFSTKTKFKASIVQI